LEERTFYYRQKLHDVKLNQVLWQKQHPATKRLFSPANWTSCEVRN